MPTKPPHTPAYRVGQRGLRHLSHHAVLAESGTTQRRVGSEGNPNIWDNVPDVVEMQHEGGAAGANNLPIETSAGFETLPTFHPVYTKSCKGPYFFKKCHTLAVT